ncbi:glycosyltransferase [Leptolyngbyaceae cyanobacterium CCMR0082]|uniref:Glycosyltransferase n=2 Tax=Adonisia turfae TaxID=2950184 RepID=A0A6M0SGI3_9CYAN|nr:WecB/TagA/CpsF family glycosyltransferase [Adonisia turfae]MDV3349967.1 WecB/TagA/CpsF family glycosyltransferase [Leptothoe sp. LEGE 181152]NEZ60276.1 glycosyltransferase [Adonisia turfae CCMR0081]NEZ67585.1 glycosyltransferase [Adonisia turfae CCMR0082]
MSQQVLQRPTPSDYKRLFRVAVLTSTAAGMLERQRARLRERVEILGVEIDNISQRQFLAELTRGVIFTPNVDHLMKLQDDAEFQEAYRQADYKVCDSQILMYASKLLGKPLKEKISGSDLLPLFCDYHRNNPGITIFFLGGAKGVAKQAQVNINARFGRDMVIAAHSPSFGFEKDEAECQSIIDIINASEATVLAVGVGAPKQELWIAKYRSHMPKVKIFMAVGAALDFEAGNKPRAPQLWSSLGIEWLYRLMSEPKRLWKRYLLDDLPFFKLLLKQKLKQVTKGKE